jgi:DNA polymerase V
MPTQPRMPQRRIRYKGGAGSLFPSEEGDLGRMEMDLSAIGIPTSQNSFAVRVEGNSMIDAGINDGDILLVEKREAKSGDIVVAAIDGQVTIKYYIADGDRYYLRSANSNYPDRELEGDWSIRAVGVGLIRKF